jgi:hypothetical protein
MSYEMKTTYAGDAGTLLLMKGKLTIGKVNFSQNRSPQAGKREN